MGKVSVYAVVSKAGWSNCPGNFLEALFPQGPLPPEILITAEMTRGVEKEFPKWNVGGKSSHLRQCVHQVQTQGVMRDNVLLRDKQPGVAGAESGECKAPNLRGRRGPVHEGPQMPCKGVWTCNSCLAYPKGLLLSWSKQSPWQM